MAFAQNTTLSLSFLFSSCSVLDAFSAALRFEAFYHATVPNSSLRYPFLPRVLISSMGLKSGKLDFEPLISPPFFWTTVAHRASTLTFALTPRPAANYKCAQALRQSTWTVL